MLKTINITYNQQSAIANAKDFIEEYMIQMQNSYKTKVLEANPEYIRLRTIYNHLSAIAEMWNNPPSRTNASIKDRVPKSGRGRKKKKETEEDAQ